MMRSVNASLVQCSETSLMLPAMLTMWHKSLQLAGSAHPNSFPFGTPLKNGLKKKLAACAGTTHMEEHGCP